MNTNWKHRALVLLCCTLLIAAPTACAAQTGEAAQTPTAQPQAAEEAAPIASELFSTYTNLDLAPYEGKAIFINFFTEWCYYCMQEMPDIKKLYDEYNEDELQVILVHVWDGEDASNSESVKATYGLEDLTFFEDEDRMVAAFVGLGGYPGSLFIAKDGTLHGAANYMLTYDQLSAYMEEMGVSKKAAAQ